MTLPRRLQEPNENCGGKYATGSTTDSWSRPRRQRVRPLSVRNRCEHVELGGCFLRHTRLVLPSYFGIQAARLCQLLAVSKSECGVRPLTLPVFLRGRALIAIFRCMARPASVRHCCPDAVEKVTHIARAESGKLKRNYFCTVMEKETGTVLLMLHNMFNTWLCHSNTRALSDSAVHDTTACSIVDQGCSPPLLLFCFDMKQVMSWAIDFWRPATRCRSSARLMMPMRPAHFLCSHCSDQRSSW